jgi:hypothetical protein
MDPEEAVLNQGCAGAARQLHVCAIISTCFRVMCLSRQIVQAPGGICCVFSRLRDIDATTIANGQARFFASEVSCLLYLNL